MKLNLCLLIFILLFPALHGTNIFVINSYSQTLSKIDLESITVNNSFALLGLAPNHMAIKGNNGYVVNSGANSVQKIDLLTGQTAANIFIADSSNPYDITIQGDFAYVTGLFTNRVYKISLLTDRVVGSIPVGLGPEGLCSTGNYLYVANTGNYPNYTPSTVSVIDLSDFSITGTIPVETNPQYLAYADGKIHVVCTGNWLDITGKICIIDPVSNSVIQTLPIGGNLGNIWVSPDHIAYIAEAMNTGVYRYNTEDFSVLNSSVNPFTPGGSALSGNNDYLGIVDAQWGQNGIVKLVNWDGAILHEYTVGMSPTDIKFFSENTANEDDTALPVINVRAFPNPFVSNIQFIVQQKGKAFRNEKIHIYNIKGQLVKTLDSLNSTWNGTDFSGKSCPGGVYLYSLDANGKQLHSGKITLFR